MPFISAYLMNQIYAVVKLLTLEEGMKVIEKMLQVLFTIPMWYNDGGFVTG